VLQLLEALNKEFHLFKITVFKYIDLSPNATSFINDGIWKEGVLRLFKN